MTPQLLDSSDVAKALAITPRQATRMMNAGTLPTVRVNRTEVRVPADALQRWIESRTSTPADDAKGDA
jgi:excisionase family DNA binding protein